MLLTTTTITELWGSVTINRGSVAADVEVLKDLYTHTHTHTHFSLLAACVFAFFCP